MSWQDQPASPRNATRPSDWSTRRRRVLERDGWTCRLQLPGCTVAASIADHIVNAGSGGSHEDFNLQASCARCHRRKTSAEANAARWRVRETRPREQHPGRL